MANWSQSHFLQSLGWATLNSFWQMALLWCLFLAVNYFIKLSSHTKYQLSVLAVVSGFVWFLLSFLTYFQSSSVSSISFFNQSIPETNSLLNIFLFSASMAYLSLLLIPAFRLFRNWQFVQKIKKQGLKKADLNCRLFVQKVAAQLGIKKKVLLYLSDLVKSPVTIGYLKPIILIPVAALNNLSTQQVEARLLHELSHIKRYDYLVNLVISIIGTILYFNPFIRQFIKSIEEERENCCDELVLQFGYDKVGYATALLTLEKLSVHQRVLALGATGKNYLLNRIEKIVGMEKKKPFKRSQLAAILAALFCIVVFNSILIIRDKNQPSVSFSFHDMAVTPFFLDNQQPAKQESISPAINRKGEYLVSRPAVKPSTNNPVYTFTAEEEVWPSTQELTEVPGFMYASLDESAMISDEQKKRVQKTVEATKKVVESMQWKQAEANIADVLTEQEKLHAREEYLKAMEVEIDWKNIEKGMNAQYENLDWNKINSNINTALTVIKLDSLEKKYRAIVVELDKVKTEIATKSKMAECPLPDQSVEAISKSREEMQKRVEKINAIRTPKKVVRL